MNDAKKNPLGRELTGTDFAGYRVGAKIGAGGYAWVYRATDVDLDRDIALKVLLPRREGGYPEKLRERFYREAKLVARLRDARSIKLLEHGEDDGLLYIAFEFIEGKALDELLEVGQPIGPLRVAKIIEQVLESLADAHDLGIIHRDIKPGNIMLYELAGRADQVKVLDFGIGKFIDRKMTMNLTREGGFLGTPRYMAPEQFGGGEVSAASDIYAVGLVAYELLTGQKAIKGQNAMEAMAEILSDEDFRVPYDVGAPKGLIDVVNKMLRKDVSQRYSSAIEVLEDIQALRSRTADLTTTGERGALWAKINTHKGRAVKGVGAVALVLLGVWAAAGVWSQMSGDERASVVDSDGWVNVLEGASQKAEQGRADEHSPGPSFVEFVEEVEEESAPGDAELVEDVPAEVQPEPAVVRSEHVEKARPAARAERVEDKPAVVRSEHVEKARPAARAERVEGKPAAVRAERVEEEEEAEEKEAVKEEGTGGPAIWAVD